MCTLACLSVLLVLMTAVAPVTSRFDLQDFKAQLGALNNIPALINSFLSPSIKNKKGCTDYPCQHSCAGTTNSFQCSCDKGYRLSAADPTRCEAVTVCDITCITCSANTGPTKCQSGFRVSASDNTKCEDIDECVSNPCDQTCTNNPGSYTCSCRDGYQVNAADAKKCDVKPCAGNQQLDMIVVMDSSGSIGKDNYDKAFDFVGHLITAFQLGPNAVQVGCIIFSKTVKKLFDLNDFYSSSDIDKVFSKAPYLNSATYTHLALNFITENNMFDAKNGGRTKTTKLIVLLTDGASENTKLTRQAADKLKSLGYIIIVIAIGKGIDSDEINDVATSTADVFKADSYSALEYIEAKVAGRACQPNAAPPAAAPADSKENSKDNDSYKDKNGKSKKKWGR